ncbi:MAG: DUF502 domain-containing protein [Mariprofundus sp.]|nr:DUF502 domain-containing protein [Mariprofundus sp.]
MISLRKYLFAGVVTLVPLLVVAALINWLIEVSDKTVALLPVGYRPDAWIGMDIPGMGIILALLFIIIIGALTTHFIGRHLMRLVDRVMGRIPLVRNVYNATRQLLESIFGDGSKAFKEVVMVPFPNQGSLVMGFVTGESPLQVSEGETTRVAVFVPSTPIPTTGWLLFVEASELKHLDISVEEGMKLLLSGGAVSTPGEKKTN